LCSVFGAHTHPVVLYPGGPHNCGEPAADFPLCVTGLPPSNCFVPALFFRVKHPVPESPGWWPRGNQTRPEGLFKNPQKKGGPFLGLQPRGIKGESPKPGYGDFASAVETHERVQQQPLFHRVKTQAWEPKSQSPSTGPFR